MISDDDLIRAIEAYCGRFPEARDYVRDLRMLLASDARCLSRKEFRGHITCSALVSNVKGEVLLIHHRTLNRWLLPGGHVEAEDSSLAAAAARELSEEAGVPFEEISVPILWAETPVHIDRHTIPAHPAKGEPEHEHWDFCYPLRVAGSVAMVQNAEVSGVEWCDQHMLPDRFAAVVEGMKTYERQFSSGRIP